MSDSNLNAYFERIGFAGSIAPNLATLEQIHFLHSTVIPFENLNPLLGLPVMLDQASLEQKLLIERRGGYCFEQNLLLMRMLESLDYSVRGYGARILWNQADDREGPRNHMLIGVDVGGVSYIADAGFGGLTLTAPLRLKADVEQQTPHEVFRFIESEGEYRLEVKIGDEWRALYAFDLAEHTDADYEAANQWAATDLSSPFLSNLIAARPQKGLRHTLRNNRLLTHYADGSTERRLLTSVAELREVLTNVIGIALPLSERLDAALSRALHAGHSEAD